MTVSMPLVFNTLPTNSLGPNSTTRPPRNAFIRNRQVVPFLPPSNHIRSFQKTKPPRGAVGTMEFESRIKKAFPEYQIREIADDDPIFHAVYDLNERYQIPGQAHLRDGHKNGATGIGAHWRAIYDDKGRVMVAITYNSDVGDAWEYADDSWYPERFSDLAIRIGVNYIMYAMSH